MRFFLRMLAAGLVIFVLAGGIGFVYLKSSLPQATGTVTLPGLDHPASISRDRDGVARIEAETEHDAYFALGWLHAQDRMWQMEMQRRTGAGRLAEILGPAALDTDRFLRTLGLYRLAEASLPHLGPEVLAALDAYTAGVNAWIEGPRGALAPEFLLLNFRPEPWRPADSIVWARLMGLQLAGNWREELLRARLLALLPPERIDQLWAPYGAQAPTTLALDDGHAAALLAGLSAVAQPRLASNVWVVGGERTPSGRPVLANDPHLSFDAPVLWHLVSISTPAFQVHGGTVPGVPFHLMGHNGTVAWGITTTHADLMDLFVERLGPEPGTYLAPGGPLAFETREEVIEVKGAAAVTLTVRTTRHGPVLSDVLPGIATADEVVALASATLLPDDTTPRAFYLLNRAQNWGDFVGALSFFHAPQQNIAYADVHGDIGFYSPGRVPIRRQGDGLLPREGWSGEWDWVGWVPFEELPHVLNPPEGWIVNANNQVVPDGYPHLIAGHWPEPYRAMRIVEVLESQERHGPAEAAALQIDNLSPVALLFRDFIATLQVQGEAAQQAQRLVAAWDGTMLRDRPEPLIFNGWMIAFQQTILAGPLGDLAPAFRIPRPRFLEVVLRQDPSWCDLPMTAEVETCPMVAAHAFEVAVAELRERHGADMAAWRWGERHQALFEHAVLRHVPYLAWLGRLQIATDGGEFTVNRGTYLGHPPELFTHVHGAGLRAVYDLADLAASRFIIATGQSGNPLSPHYRDMLERWRDGAYVQFTPRAEDHVLILRPPS